MRERAAPTQVPIVLLAEADSSLRRWLALLLAEAGYGVLEAGAGPAVLQHLRGSARIDIVVTNTRIGGMRGWEVVQAAAQLRAGVPIVRIIQSGADAVPLYGVDPGAVRLLQKPFTITDLLSAIRSLLAHSSTSVPPADRVVPTWLQ